MTTYTCEQCGALFQSKHQNGERILCGACRIEWNREQDRIRKRNAPKGKKKDKPLGLAEIQRQRQQYIEKTGRYISYGEFIRHMGEAKA